MKLQTEVQLPNYDFKIDYDDKLFFIGSCFSNEISKKFQYYSYDIVANPYGTVYNSRAISHQLKSILQDDFDFQNWIVQNENQFVSLLHNTEFRSDSEEKLLLEIKSRANNARKQLQNADYCFITMGTAKVFRYEKTGLIVSNCQKLPAEYFTREELSIHDIVEDLMAVKKMVNQLNPECKFIVTVSPVRHQKDGFIANQQSKARLILAAEKFQEQENVYYFPSYEIVLDELRDYRFYGDDLVHLNELGVNYVWEKVNRSLLNQKEATIRQALEKFRKLEQHKVVDESKKQAHEVLVSERKKEIEKQFNISIYE